MPTVAEIAATAFAAVSSAIPGAIGRAVVTRSRPGAYNPATGIPASPTEMEAECDCVVDQRSRLMSLYARALEIQEGDTLIWLRAIAFVPQNTDRIQVGTGRLRTIVFVDDLLDQGGAVVAVVAR